MTTKPTAQSITLDIQVDLITVEDLEVIDMATRGEATLAAEIAIFDRVVVGGVRSLKARDIRKIRNAILDELVKDANSPN